MRSWPSVIAHEVDRLVADFEGRPADRSAPRQPPSPEAVLFQLRDTVETLLKFPALVLARALIEHGTPEDGRRVRGDCFGRLSGGNWLGIASGGRCLSVHRRRCARCTRSHGCSTRRALSTG